MLTRAGMACFNNPSQVVPNSGKIEEYAGDVPARMREARYQTGFDGVDLQIECQDGNATRCGMGRPRLRWTYGN